MKTILQSLSICVYQLRILSRNYKLYALPVCLFVFMWNALEPLRNFVSSVGVDATPFLFSFLFDDIFLCPLLFAGILLFFTDAPFYDKQQLFVVLRCQAFRWSLGQIIYVFVISVFYTGFLLFLSILILFPHLSFKGDWGKIWTTLAITGAGSELGLSFGVSKSVLFDYTPLQAVALTFLLVVLICSLYGFLMWCLNLYLGRAISLILVLASICLVIRIRFLPTWLTYLCPSSWADLAGLSEYALHGLSLPTALVILLIGNIFLAVLAFFKTIHSDIAK